MEQGREKIGNAECNVVKNMNNQDNKIVTLNDIATADCTPPLALWAPLFLKEQGHNVEENVIEQDNESATLLANNGKASSGK